MLEKKTRPSENGKTPDEIVEELSDKTLSLSLDDVASSEQSPPKLDNEEGDWYENQTKRGSDENFLVELHGFPASYKTSNLTALLKDYKGEYQLKWVDDTSAVVIFDSVITARNAMKYLSDEVIRIRWYDGDLKEELIQSATRSRERTRGKERPETSALVARRLVSNALGLGRQLRNPEMQKKIASDNEKIEKARDRRREAKEKQKAVDSVFDED